MIPLLLVISLFSCTCGLSWTDLINEHLPFREQRLFHRAQIYDEYDFIVIGSGPAGSAVAARLAEIPEWDVLLLEAGEEGTLANDIPAVNPTFPLTKYSWGYKSEYQEDICRGHEGRVCPLPSGRGVGGGSVMNGMLMTRGDPKDYDKWNQTGWYYDDVFPYFLKSEKMNIRNLKYSPVHSSTGAVSVEHSYPSKLRKRFLDAGYEFGYDIVDYNDPSTPEGFGNPQVCAKKGKRFSASSAYLKPIKDSSNFHLSKKSLVTKILIDSEKTAHGVVFIKNNKEKTVYARKEIILSAGAYNTPKLLMLSGIGPQGHLEELDIPLIKDLPVGNNLQNHLTTLPLTYLINTTDSYTIRKFAVNFISYYRRWVTNGKGPLANSFFDGVAFVRTDPDIDQPDIELSLIPLTWGTDYGIGSRKVLGIREEVFYPEFGQIVGAQGFSIMPILLHPKSRGMVRLNSKDHRDQPKIILNSLKDRNDVEVLIEGIRTSIRLVESTSPFIEIGARLHKGVVPGCKSLEFGSDQYWECVLREITFNIHHHCCTAKMGESSDSVVDNRLRVHGIGGLRVADASIMPSIPAAHLMYPCYMIGEKAADIIKEDWGQLTYTYLPK